jgi:hypothetical protein
MSAKTGPYAQVAALGSGGQTLATSPVVKATG